MKKNIQESFLGERIDFKGAVRVNLIKSILQKLNDVHPIDKGNGLELAKKLQAQGVTPETMLRVHTILGQLPRRSEARAVLHPQIKLQQDRLHSAFLLSIPEKDRPRFIVEKRTLPPQGKFPTRHTPPKFTVDDDRKKGRN